MRNLISTQWHAFLDYMSAFTLLIGPWLFGYSDDPTGKSISLLFGGLIILMSLLTRYEGGLFKAVPMALHLNIDVLVGLFLIISPFIFDLMYEAYLFFVLIGFFILGSGLFSLPTPKKHHPPVDIRYDTDREGNIE